jgi:hypothetical protein
MQRPMTEDEFVAQYAEGTGLSPDQMRARMLANRNAVPTPCDCGKAYCDGWAWEDRDRFLRFNGEHDNPPPEI